MAIPTNRPPATPAGPSAGTALANLAAIGAEMEQVVSECNLAALESQGRFQRAITLSKGVQALRRMLTHEVMQAVVMPLMNTPLGFRTDRDNGKPPYDEGTVRECFIESVIRGFMPVGNEWNILSARCYGTKEGFARLVRNFPGLTDLKLSLAIPRMVGGADARGAIVIAKATWKVEGKKDAIDREIPVRVNSGMGADAILGKATRKLMASIYGQLTGSEYSVPEGDASDTGESVVIGPAPKSHAASDLESRLKASTLADVAKPANGKPGAAAAPPAAPPAPPAQPPADGPDAAQPGHGPTHATPGEFADVAADMPYGPGMF